MSDLRDFTGKNRKFTGTSGIRVPIGTQGQRVDTQASLRFNSSNALFEYYTGTEWKSIDAPPIVNTIAIDGGSDVTSLAVDSTLSGDFSLVVKGSLFSTSGTVTVVFEPTSGSNITASGVTVNNANQMTVTNAYSDFVNANEPYSIKVTNPSGLSATLADCIIVDSAVVFTNAAGSLATVGDAARGTTVSAGATDADGDTITYSITAGSLPAGASLNTSTGGISGFSAVGSNTTSTFTVQAATTDVTITREYSITVNAPVTATYTATNSDQSFTAPAGVNAVSLKMWGAGGAGSNQQSWGGSNGGGGGGYASGTVTVTPGNDYVIVVGDGGTASDESANYGGGGKGNSWGTGSGGGLTGFFDGSGQVFSTASPQSGAHGRSLLIAGGGGGGGANRGGNCQGGAGGGTNGQNGTSPNSGSRGQGGQQNAGGSGNSSGAALRGGDSNTGHAGGGGGGYYGGGAGQYNEPQDMGGGGGGSGYYSPSAVNSATLTNGSGQSPGNSGDSDRSGAADGGGGGGGSGDDGRMRMDY